MDSNLLIFFCNFWISIISQFCVLNDNFHNNQNHTNTVKQSFSLFHIFIMEHYSESYKGLFQHFFSWFCSQISHTRVQVAASTIV